MTIFSNAVSFSQTASIIGNPFNYSPQREIRWAYGVLSKRNPHSLQNTISVWNQLNG